jgi:hypothetical protein
LQAGYSGTIIEVQDGWGVTIKENGALVQGIWGNGRLESGLLLSVIQSPKDVFTRDLVDVSLRGAVLLGGYVEDAEVFRNAAELPVRGLIISSMSPALVPLALQMRYPIIVLEGFGARPFNQQAFKLLTTNVKRETNLNAQTLNPYEGQRPEIVIPLPVSQDPTEPQDVEAFAPDQTVRLLRNPRAGEIGTIIHLRPGLTRLPNGISAPAADVRLLDNEMLVVPLTNLEIIG